MRKSGGTATKVGGIDTQRCVQEWRRRWPVKTAACLAEFYGAPLRTVENWLAGVARPSGDWRDAIFLAECPTFLEAVIPEPPAYIREAADRIRSARRLARRERLAREIAELDAELDELER